MSVVHNSSQGRTAVQWPDGKGKMHEGVLEQFLYRPGYVDSAGRDIHTACVGIVQHKLGFIEVLRSDLEFVRRTS